MKQRSFEEVKPEALSTYKYSPAAIDRIALIGMESYQARTDLPALPPFSLNQTFVSRISKLDAPDKSRFSGRGRESLTNVKQLHFAASIYPVCPRRSVKRSFVMR